MRPLVILGAGGFGAEVAALVEDINCAAPTWALSGFLDDDPSLHGTRVLGYPVLGDSSWLARRHDHAYVIGIGGSKMRARVASRISQHPVEPAVLVHPTACIHESSRIGAGGIICRGGTVTVRAKIGQHVIANLHVTVGHDANLGDFTTLHPAVNLSGNSRTGACVEIGTGAILLPGTEVGRGSVIGAGAVVTRNVPPDSVAVGVPAAVTRTISEAVAN